MRRRARADADADAGADANAADAADGMPSAGVGRLWVPTVNQRVRLLRRTREDWDERAMEVTVTSVNKEKETFCAEGLGSGGNVKSKGFRLIRVPFAHIEKLLDIVQRTRGVGDKSMIRKKRHAKTRAAPAAAPAAVPAAVLQAAVAAAPARSPALTVAAKAAELITELGMPAQSIIAAVVTEAERQLGWTASPSDKISQRLDKVFQELIA